MGPWLSFKHGPLQMTAPVVNPPSSTGQLRLRLFQTTPPAVNPPSSTGQLRLRLFQTQKVFSVTKFGA